MPSADSLYDELIDGHRFNGNFSQHMEQTLQNKAFMTGLRTGGLSNNLMVDAIVVRSGEPFRTGDNWQRVEFRQG